MLENNEAKEQALTLLTINKLKEEKMRVEALVAEYQKILDAEQAMLDKLLIETETPENEQYLKLAKKACHLGIHAWACDIEDLRPEIDMYTAKINTCLARIPTGEIQ
jgi:hypothetical protein